MKKFYVMMAAALVAFSLASCNKKGQNEPEQPKQDTTEVVSGPIKIEVSNIMANSAEITFAPQDTDAYYAVAVYSKAEVAKMGGDDSVAVYMTGTLQSMIDQYKVTLDILYQYDYVCKGNLAGVFALDPETDYTVYAVLINEENVAVPAAVCTKSFSTPKLEPKETVTVNVAGGLLDYSDLMGTFMVTSDDINAAGDYIVLTIDADSVTGSFTEADFNEEYVSGIISGEDFVLFATAALNGAYVDDSTYVISGTALAGNGTQYNMTITCATGADDDDDWMDDLAPAKLPKANKFVKILK